MIITDHNALKWLHNVKDLSGRLTRWSLKLSDHNFTIEYRKGKDNANADALSRMNYIEMINNRIMNNQLQITEEIMEEETMEDEDNDLDQIRLEAGIRDMDTAIARSMDEIYFEQMADPLYGNIIRYLLMKRIPSNQTLEEQQRMIEMSKWFEVNKKDGLLRKKSIWIDKEDNNKPIEYYRLVLPETLRQEYMKQMHEEVFGGHLGRARTTTKLTDRYWWPRMIEDIKKWVVSCPVCQERKNPIRTIAIRPNILASTPFQVVAVDIIGPLPKTKDGYEYAIVFIDYLTKFVEAFPLKTISTKRIATVLIEQIVCRYGAPRALLSDLGSNFISKLARSVYNLLDIHKLNTSSYHPQTNGLVEKFNSTLKTMLRMYVDLDQRNWAKFIPYCVFAYNTSRQETTRYTPYYMLFGRSATLPVDVMSTTEDEIYTNEDEFIQKRIINMRYAHKFAEDAHRKIHLKYKTKLEKKTHDKYEVGDKVYCRIYQPKFGIPRKEALLWHGPFIILEVKTKWSKLCHKETRNKSKKNIISPRKQYQTLPCSRVKLEKLSWIRTRRAYGRGEIEFAIKNYFVRGKAPVQNNGGECCEMDSLIGIQQWG